MKEKLTQLLQEGKDRIAAVRSEAELQEVKALLLGKQGSLTGLAEGAFPSWTPPCGRRWARR